MKTILSRMALMAVMLFVSLSAAAERITQEQLNKLVGTYRLEIPGHGDVRASVAANGDFSLILEGEAKGFNLLDDDEAVITDNMITFFDDHKFLLQDGVATHFLLEGVLLVPREGSFEDGLEILPLIAGRYVYNDDYTDVITIDEKGDGLIMYGPEGARFNVEKVLSWYKNEDVIMAFFICETFKADDPESSTQALPFVVNFILRDGEVAGLDFAGEWYDLVEKIDVETGTDDTMYLVVTYGDKVFRVKADDTVKVEWKTGAELRK